MLSNDKPNEFKLIEKGDPFAEFDSETPDYGISKQKFTRIGAGQSEKK